MAEEGGRTGKEGAKARVRCKGEGRQGRRDCAEWADDWLFLQHAAVDADFHLDRAARGSGQRGEARQNSIVYCILYQLWYSIIRI